MNGSLSTLSGLLYLCGWVCWAAAPEAGPCAAEPASDAVAADFFVAPQGQDTWSGRLPTKNDKGDDGPFASFARAQQAVRDLMQSGRTEPVTVMFRGGTYRLDEPITFKPANSGTDRAPITYAAYPGETPVFSGGKRIETEWTRNDDGTWTTKVKTTKNYEWFFRQLFVNGRRAIRARTPNNDYLRTEGPMPGLDPKTKDRYEDRSRQGFRFRPGDIKPWQNLGDVNVFVYHSWTTSLHWIDSIDEKNSVIRFTNKSGWPFSFFEDKQRYFIENCREALDAPGEWYLDRWAATLTYKPLDGQDVPKTEFIAPVLHQLVIFDGDRVNGDCVHHVALRGLSFRHADWLVSREGWADGQGASVLSAAISADGTQHVDLIDCEVAQVGEYAIHFNRGCSSNRIVNCHIHDLGAGGVRIGATTRVLPSHDVSENNTVDNCLIHDGGHVFRAGIGVLVGKASHTTISHNDIFDLDYTGVSVGWYWGIEQVPSAHHNIIEFNHIYNIGRGQLSDMGGIYTLGNSPGTVLRNNLIHDVLANQNGGNGMYNDSRCAHVLMENNIVYRCNDSAYHLNHGTDNLLRNNILAFGGIAEITSSNRDDPPPTVTLERNIVYTRLPRMHAYEILWKQMNFAMDHNLYYRAGGESFDWPGDRTFQQWQEWTGQDRHSIIADPLFVDPENGDFRLKPGSPAEKIGFKPIDMTKVGRRRAQASGTGP